MRGVEVGEGKRVGDNTGVVVSVIVGDKLGEGVVVGGKSVNTLSGKVNWPEGTQAVRMDSINMSNDNKIIFEIFMFGMIP